MTPTCDICHIEMVFKERIKSKKQYRIRRFECPVCGHIQTMFADGYYDLKVVPDACVKDLKRMYKEEKEARL